MAIPSRDVESGKLPDACEVGGKQVGARSWSRRAQGDYCLLLFRTRSRCGLGLRRCHTPPTECCKGESDSRLTDTDGLLQDEDGSLGSAMAELAVLEESLTEEDRLRFGNLIPAHIEKQRQLVRSQIDGMIKHRNYVTGAEGATRIATPQQGRDRIVFADLRTSVDISI